MCVAEIFIYDVDGVDRCRSGLVWDRKVEHIRTDGGGYPWDYVAEVGLPSEIDGSFVVRAHIAAISLKGGGGGGGGGGRGRGLGHSSVKSTSQVPGPRFVQG
ncbi:hypothetical protein M0802_004877 [Mischocyttarus mexicanus]|nr:hypothetical protein M0802_004877 [Mischocyttarus mexicanus]